MIDREDDGDRGEEREDQERRPPAEGAGEEAAEQGAEDLAERVGGAVEAEDLRPVLGAVVVGDERVVGRVDDQAADGGPGAGDDEDPDDR